MNLKYGNGHNTTLPLEVFTQKNFVAAPLHPRTLGCYTNIVLLLLNRLKLNFIQKSLLSHPLGDLGVELSRV